MYSNSQILGLNSLGIETVESHQAKNPVQIQKLTPGVLDALSNIIYQSHAHKVSYKQHKLHFYSMHSLELALDCNTWEPGPSGALLCGTF